MTTTPDLDQARVLLRHQPFSRLLGAEVTVFEPGVAELQVPVRDDLLQQDGYVHGGVLAYAADNAITFAGGSVLGAAVLTAGMSVTYLRPAQGEVLVASARVEESTSRRAVCHCTVSCRSSGTDTVVLVATGTVAATG